MRYVKGTKHSELNDQRMSNSMLAGYTVYEDGGTYYSEANFPEGTDYIEIDAKAAIQKAVNAAAGRKVFIKKGTYDVKDLTLVSGLTLEGEGKETILKLADNANTNLIKDFTAQDNITIKNIVFDGNKTNQSDGDDRNERATLWLKKKSYFTLDNITIKNTRSGASLVLEESNHIWIRNSLFLDNGTADSAFECDHIWIGADSYTIIVDSNQFKNCTDVGLALDNDRNVAITNCIFEECTQGSITMWNAKDTYNTAQDYVINNCVFRSDGKNTIFYSGLNTGLSHYVERLLISNCVFNGSDNQLKLVGIRKAVINNCYIGYGDGKGILMDDAHDIKVHNCIFTDLTYGIRFEVSASSNIQIADNRFISVTTPIDENVAPTAPLYQNNVGNVGAYQTQTGAWANPSGTPANGTRVVVYNSTQGADRLYCYSNGAWHYEELTAA